MKVSVGIICCILPALAPRLGDGRSACLDVRRLDRPEKSE